jgi:amino acid permease
MLFPLTLSLKRPSEKRFNKIINRVHFALLLSYATIGIAGYLLLVEHESIRHINSIVISSIPTIPTTIGKVVMLISLFLAIPLNMLPAR